MSFVGGIPEWRTFNYPMTVDPSWRKIKIKRFAPVAFKSLIDTGDFYLVDVRPQNYDRDKAFIAGAQHYPLVTLNERYQELPKDKKLLIADWAMKQSSTAAKFLSLKGYEIQGVLKGGMERWRAESLPVEERTPVN